MKRERDDAHRQLISTPDDLSIYDWLESLFYLHPRVHEESVAPGTPPPEADKFPERIVLRATRSMGRAFSTAIHEEIWKPTQAPMPTRERLVALANKYLAKAKQHCAAIGKRQVYALQAFSLARGSDPYSMHLVSLTPGPAEFSENEPPPDDDDEAGVSPRELLRELYRDRRWLTESVGRFFENYSSAMEGLVARYEQRLSATEHVAQALIQANYDGAKLREELLDRKSERDLRERKEVWKQQTLESALSFAQSLAPPVIAYLTKGKLGIPQGAQMFLSSLTAEQKVRLFGVWDATTGACTQAGILDEEQCRLLASIAENKAPPSAMAEFVRSIRPEQMMAVSTGDILGPEQITSLLALARAAEETAGGGGGNPGALFAPNGSANGASS